MVTGGKISDLLVGSDQVSDRLISHVSLHIKPETCKQFATGPLGLNESRFDLIAADYHCQQARINIEVSKIKRCFLNS